ncbi:MAG: hypothetical protein K5657_06715, partial [Desulfovibrio sp.]|nr:hypothetical protein [Desulfovibrio sp.]
MSQLQPLNSHGSNSASSGTLTSAQTRGNVPPEFANARVSRTERASTGFSIRSIFIAIGRALGIARATEPSLQRVQPVQHEAAGRENPVNPAVQEQENTAHLIDDRNYRDLPDSVKQIGDNVVSELRNRYGEELIPTTMKFTSLIDCEKLSEKILALQNDGWKNALTDLIRESATDGALQRVAKKIVKSFGEEQNLTFSDVNIENNAKKLMNNPQILTQLRESASVQAARNIILGVLQNDLPNLRRESEITRCRENSKLWAAELMAQKTGFSTENLLESVSFSKLGDKIVFLMSDINKKFDNNPDFNIEQEFRKVIKEFVDSRTELAGKVDKLEISEGLKEQWKNEFLQFGLPKGLNPADFVLLGKAGTGAFLKAMLDMGRTGKDLANDVLSTAENLDKQQTQFYGGGFLADLGAEGRDILFSHLAQVMMDSTPGLADGLFAQREALGSNLQKFKTMYAFNILDASGDSSQNVAVKNNAVASIIEQPRLKKQELHINQGLYDGVAALKTAFGNDGLPSDVKDVFNMKLPDGRLVKNAVAERVRGHSRRVTRSDMAAIVKEVLTPVLRKKTVDQMIDRTISDAIRDLGIKLSPKDKDRIVSQLQNASPELGTATSRDEVQQILHALPNLRERIIITQLARTHWENITKTSSSQLARAFGISETRVQEKLGSMPDLYDEYMELDEAKRAEIMTNPDGFHNWSKSQLQARMDGISNALA